MPTASESDASALSSAGGGADDKAPPVASLPKTRDAAVPPPTPAPATLAFSEPVAVAVVYVYAPVLPIDVLRVVFAPLACDVKTLSAAACVSVAWRDAALEHSLWGLTRLRFAPKAARKLTNQALRALVQRTGSSLQRVNLAGCTQLNARGVATALHGMKLDTLALRGVKYLSNSSVVMVKLQKLVRRPTCLDVSKSPTCGCTAPAHVRRCLRLCGPQDMLCETCSVVRCTQCFASAKKARNPPCRHLCDGCFRGNHVLLECEACGRAPNGFCSECTTDCDTCSVVFCDDCRFGPGALLKCAGDECESAYCHACIFDKPDSPLLACQGCSARFCESCSFEAGEMLFCERCDEPAFCSGCAETMTVDGELLCPDCAADVRSDDSDDESSLRESSDDSD
jgi:hypothetical protein